MNTDLPFPPLLAGALAMALSASPTLAAARACLPLAPLKVTLSGRLDSRPAATETTVVQRLRLVAPTCVAASAGHHHDDVRSLGLRLDPALAAQLHPDASGRVRLTGTLSETDTEADGTPLWLRVTAIDGD